MNGNGQRGRVLVIGGGISGITAAIEASEAGCEVVLVERAPYLGGRVVRMHQYFPKLCPPICGLEINLRVIRSSSLITCYTLSEVEKISGEPGRFDAVIRRSPRFVHTSCTACGLCTEACPVDRPDEFNYGMGTTKAIYLPFTMSWPLRYVIDPAVCPGQECGRCVPACPYGAIDLAEEPETIKVEVGAVIWATGWEPYDAGRLEDLGFGTYPNVITNLMMERLAASSGPTGGRIRRPSDGKEVQSVAFVQCAGSRDENHLKYCSGVCCMGTLKQTRYVRKQQADAQMHVFYIDVRSPGRLEDFYAAVQEDEKLELIRGKAVRIAPGGADGDLIVTAEDTLSGRRISREVSMVVLATGLVPVDAGTQVGAAVGLRKDEYGFMTDEQPRGFAAVGCAKRPEDVSACVRDATGAALRALQACGR